MYINGVHFAKSLGKNIVSIHYPEFVGIGVLSAITVFAFDDATPQGYAADDIMFSTYPGPILCGIDAAAVVFAFFWRLEEATEKWNAAQEHMEMWEAEHSENQERNPTDQIQESENKS